MEAMSRGAGRGRGRGDGDGDGDGGRRVVAETKLVAMHGRAGRMEMATQVFRGMADRDVVAWNAFIAAHACSRDIAIAARAFPLFSRMRRHGFLPDAATFMSLLRACARLRSLRHGYGAHSAHLLMAGDRLPRGDARLCNMLIHVYAACGSMRDACGVFSACLPPRLRTSASWTAIISGFAKQGQAEAALAFFHAMNAAAAAEPDGITYLSALHACASICGGGGGGEEGELLHAAVLMEPRRIEPHVARSIGNALIHMYARCGSLVHAIEAFEGMAGKDVVSWSALIAAHVKHGSDAEALHLYGRMSREGGISPNRATFLGLFGACAGLADSTSGDIIHADLIETIIERAAEKTAETDCALIDMYAKCGRLSDARSVFERSGSRDSAAANAMVSGHVRHEAVLEAWKLCQRMPEESLGPDAATLVNALSACAALASLDKGKALHARIASESSRRLSPSSDPPRVRTALIDMYCKCGDLPSAAKLFGSCRSADAILCAAQIGAYAQHGMRREACRVADRMGLRQLNDVCFLGLIAACGHAGDVEEGCVFFSLMSTSCERRRPRLQHYTCVVDMFGRAGRVEEGLCIVEEMSYKPTAEIWLALLGSCRLSGNLKLAENAAECIWMLDPENTSAFRLLVTTYDNFAGT